MFSVNSACLKDHFPTFDMANATAAHATNILIWFEHEITNRTAYIAHPLLMMNIGHLIFVFS